mmetsp:Transcript_17470/g.26933  ORF Transcript_17470/g.26933 Transcript_17470/m.26933 type:complete len:136 (+) Transcript_17470:110-517(+)
MAGGQVFRDNTRVIDAGFGLNLQVVGAFKLPSQKGLMLLKLKEGLVLLNAVTGSIFKLNMKKCHSTLAANLVFGVQAEKQLVEPGRNLRSPGQMIDADLKAQDSTIPEQQQEETQQISEKYSENFDEESKKEPIA